MAGRRLAHYEIGEEIGRGGMGQVYLAEDTKLSRKIALKVLPPEMAESPERLNRFEREAKAVAALNHANIVTIYSVEETDGLHFLTMERVEGKSLSQLIPKKGLPLHQFLDIAIALADAVAAAHEKGIMHRDLKPDNLMLTNEGQLKILDFGLAKFNQELAREGVSELSTRSQTAAGRILGTVAYMSPEQAEGKTVDHRTDIFSLGIILYQMLTGRSPFQGGSPAGMLSAIIKDTPPSVTELNPAVPRDLGKIVKRCLVKDPEHRYQTAKDLRNELEEIKAEGLQAVADTATPSRVRDRIVWGLAIFVAALLGGAVVWSVTRPDAPMSGPPTRFTVTLPATDQLVTTGTTSIALSADGRELVYVGNRGGITQLYRRSMNDLEAVPIQDTEGAQHPFFSPDGKWVGFFAEAKLKKVPLAGGESVELCDARAPWGGSWGPDDVIVFSSDAPGLRQVSASGGAPKLVTTRESGEVRHETPDVLPGGLAVLFTVYTDSRRSARIAVQSLETGERRMLERGDYPRYAPTGHIVFQRANSLWAVPFDIDRLAVTAAPTPVLEGVQTGTGGQGNFALASDGSLVYVPALVVMSDRKFVWVDRTGREEPIAVEPQAYQEFALSPDGTKIAVRIAGSDHDDLWIYDFRLDTWTRLTFDPAGERNPLWTPDGKRVAFGGSGGMFTKSADGTGEAERILGNPSNQRPEAFSFDGTILVFQDLSSGRDLAMVPLKGERVSTSLLAADFEERNAELSPDGRWIAYESNESGQDEIYLRPFPDVHAGRWQASSDGGHWPLWSPDGRELFYVGPQSMMVVTIETEPTITLGRREPLFDLQPYWTSNVRHRVALSPDGQKFLLLKVGAESEDTAPPQSIVVVENWFEELKRLVPTN